MLNRHSAAFSLLASLAIILLTPQGAHAGGGFGGEEPDVLAPPAATGGAGNGAVHAGATTPVTIDTGGATTTGTPFSSTRRVEVPRRCWYGAGRTGQEYYDHWHAQDSPYWSRGDHANFIDPSLHDGYQEHATETTGRWYEAQCASHVPAAEARAYYDAHPPVYVLPGTPAPPADEGLDPAFLAQVAFEHMELPTGTIRWNPSLDGTGATIVNLPTFIWIENAATEVQVTASVPGVTSTVTARMTTLHLEADGAEDRTCTDTGTPYTPGMRHSDCSIEFYRSSANQKRDKPGTPDTSLPTTTLRATATWDATWTSTLDPTTYQLESQPIVTTAEIPVAEIQTIVTR